MNESDVLALTYYHTCTVKRPDLIKTDGFDEYGEVEVYTNIPCAISYSGGSTEGESDTVQRINYTNVLFARPEIRIKPGDKVIADIFGDVFEYLAGEGMVYQSHIEIPLIRSDVA